MNELVSVIVPVYNVEEYLDMCLKSIIGQTYSNIEIIIVDDGSTDQSGRKCDEIMLLDERVSVYHKVNGGLSDARNYGLSKAHGQYIMFVDSDDCVSEDIVDYLLSLIHNELDAIAVCDIVHMFENKEKVYCAEKQRRKMTSSEAICEMLYQKSFLVSACGKLFPKRLFENIQFPVGKRFEDSAVMYKLFDLVNTIVYGNAKLYGYMHRTGSITTGCFSKSDCDIIDICKDIVDYFAERNNKELQLAADSYQVVGALRIYLTAPNSFEYKEVKDEAIEVLKQKGKRVMRCNEARKKTRIGLVLYFYARPFVKMIHKRLNRWK